MPEIKDKEQIKCPDCKKTLHIQSGIYLCDNCMEAWRNRGHGFVMYERLGKTMFLIINLYKEVEAMNKKLDDLEKKVNAAPDNDWLDSHHAQEREYQKGLAQCVNKIIKLEQRLDVLEANE